MNPSSKDFFSFTGPGNCLLKSFFSSFCHFCIRALILLSFSAFFPAFANEMLGYLDANSEKITRDLGFIQYLVNQERWLEARFGIRYFIVKFSSSVPQGTWLEDELKKRLSDEIVASTNIISAALRLNRDMMAIREGEKWVGREIEMATLLPGEKSGALWQEIARAWEKSGDSRTQAAKDMARAMASEELRLVSWEKQSEELAYIDPRTKIMEQQIYEYVLSHEARLRSQLAQYKKALNSDIPVNFVHGDPLDNSMALFLPPDSYIRALMANGIQNLLACNISFKDYRQSLSLISELKVYDPNDIRVEKAILYLLVAVGLFPELSDFSKNLDERMPSINSVLERHGAARYGGLVALGLFAKGNFKDGVKYLKSAIADAPEDKVIDGISQVLYQTIAQKANINPTVWKQMLSFKNEESSIAVAELGQRFPGGILPDKQLFSSLNRDILMVRGEEILNFVIRKNYVIPELAFSEAKNDKKQEIAAPAQEKQEKGREEGQPIISLTQFFIFVVIFLIIGIIYFYLSQFEYSIFFRKKSKTALFERAENLMNEKKYQESIKQLLQLEDLTLFDDEEAKMEYMLAKCFFHKGDLMEAIIRCKKALLKQKNDDFMALLGEIYLKAEEYSENSRETYEYLEKIDHIGKNWAQALGKTYNLTRKYDEAALLIFQKLGRKNPRDKEIQKSIARCYIEIRRIDKDAQAFMNNFRNSLSGDKEARILYCRYLAVIGNNELLIPECLAAIIMEPDDGILHNLYRDAHRKVGNIDEMVKSYEELCKRFPDNIRLKERLKDAKNLHIAVGKAQSQGPLEINQGIGDNFCEKCGQKASFSDLICAFCGAPLT